MKTKVLFSIFYLFTVVFTNAITFAQDKDSSINTSIAQSAYSRVASYVNNDTFLVVRIDLDSIDEEKMCATYNDIFIGFLKERGFDRNAINASNREFRKTLAVIKSKYGKILNIQEQFGVREAFLVMQKQIDSARVILPLSIDQRQAILQTASLIFSNQGIYISEVANGVCFTYNKQLDVNIYKDFKSETNIRLKTFLANSAGATIQIYCSNLKLNKLLEMAEKIPSSNLDAIADKLPEETRKGLDSFDAAFQNAQISYDFNTYTYKSAYSFTTAERAEDFRIGLEKLIVYVVDSVIEKINLSPKESDNYNLNGLYRELLKGALLNFVPQRNDSILSYESHLQSKKILSHPCVVILGNALVYTFVIQKFSNSDILHDLSGNTIEDETKTQADTSDEKEDNNTN